MVVEGYKGDCCEKLLEGSCVQHTTSTLKNLLSFSVPDLQRGCKDQGVQLKVVQLQVLTEP